MGTTAQKLQKILESKNAIKAAIEAKGVMNVGDKLADYASKIVSIPSGGSGEPSAIALDLGRIGYTSVPQFLSDAISVAEEIMNKNEPISIRKFRENKRLLFYPMHSAPAENMEGAFTNSNLMFFPKIDTSQVTSFNNAFQNTPLLTLDNLDTTAATSCAAMFSKCSLLVEAPALDLSKALNLANMFSECTSLKRIPPLNTEKANDLSGFINGCRNLERVECISFKSITNASNLKLVSSGIYLRYLLIKDIGYQQSITSLTLRPSGYWGVNDESNPDAFQSLYDTLVTYSFDRKSAGYPECTIDLQNETDALITPEMKSAVEAKGFRIL